MYRTVSQKWKGPVCPKSVGWGRVPPVGNPGAEWAGRMLSADLGPDTFRFGELKDNYLTSLSLSHLIRKRQSQAFAGFVEW